MEETDTHIQILRLSYPNHLTSLTWSSTHYPNVSPITKHWNLAVVWWLISSFSLRDRNLHLRINCEQSISNYMKLNQYQCPERLWRVLNFCIWASWLIMIFILFHAAYTFKYHKMKNVHQNDFWYLTFKDLRLSIHM